MTIQDGEVLRAAARLRSASGEDIVNVYHWKWTGDPVDLSLVVPSVSQALDGRYDEIQPGIPSDVTFVDISYSNATTGEVYPAQSWPTQTSGGGTGDTMPEQCCGLIVGRTNAPHTMGRKFIGPFIEADNADGAWASGLVTAFGLFLSNYLSDIAVSTLGNMTPVVVTYVGNAITRIKSILSGFTSNAIYTQRRRRRGVGA